MRVRKITDNYKGLSVKKPCPQCDGTGTTTWGRCIKCNGSGTV